MSSSNLLPDLHIGFSRGRSGGLVFPSLSEFSAVYCDPHSQCYLTPISKLLGFPDSSVGKQSACSAGDLGLILGLGRYPREGQGCPLQYSGLENSMDCIVHGVAKSRT